MCDPCYCIFILGPHITQGWNKHVMYEVYPTLVYDYMDFLSSTHWHQQEKTSLLPTAIHLQNHSFPVCMYGHIRIIILYPCSKYLYQLISALMCNAILLLLFLLHSFLKLLMSFLSKICCLIGALKFIWQSCQRYFCLNKTTVLSPDVYIFRSGRWYSERESISMQCHFRAYYICFSLYLVVKRLLNLVNFICSIDCISSILWGSL